MRPLFTCLRFRALFPVAILSAAIGCSESSEKVTPVSGTLSVSGKPLPFGVVTFQPDATKGNATRFSPLGTVRDGKFELQTNGKSGAPVGWYRVTIATEIPGVSPPPGVTLPPIPQAARNPETTPLKAEVTEKAAPGAYDLKLN
jgi:hypothetical protein